MESGLLERKVQGRSPRGRLASLALSEDGGCPNRGRREDGGDVHNGGIHVLCVFVSWVLVTQRRNDRLSTCQYGEFED